MLVLSRKRHERIWIGEGVRITIVKLDRHQVRLGIEAPGHIGIVREEVLRVEEPADSAAGRPGVEATAA